MKEKYINNCSQLCNHENLVQIFQSWLFNTETLKFFFLILLII